MEMLLAQPAFPRGQTYHCKTSFIELLSTFAFQKAPQGNSFLLAWLCSSGLSISAHRLCHMSFSLFVPFSFYSPWWNTSKDKPIRRLMSKICMHTLHSLSTVLVVYPSWKAFPTAMFPLQTRSPNYHWIFIPNSHLIRVRTPCTFSNKLPIISKPHCLISCFFTFAA